MTGSSIDDPSADHQGAVSSDRVLCCPFGCYRTPPRDLPIWGSSYADRYGARVTRPVGPREVPLSRLTGTVQGQPLDSVVREKSTAASTCRRMVGKTGTGLSAAEISSSISVQPRTTPSAPDSAKPMMMLR